MQRRHRVEEVRHQRRAGVDPGDRLLERRVGVAEADGDAGLAQPMNQRERAGPLGRQRHHADGAHAQQVVEHVVDRRARARDLAHAVSARPRRRQQRALQVQPGHARARRAARVRQRGAEGPVVRRAAADGGGQERGDARRRQAARQRAQRPAVAPDLQPETAVDLQVDQPGRHDLGVEARRRQRPDVAETNIHDPTPLDDERALHQIPVDEQASGDGCNCALSVVARRGFCHVASAIILTEVRCAFRSRCCRPCPSFSRHP